MGLERGPQGAPACGGDPRPAAGARGGPCPGPGAFSVLRPWRSLQPLWEPTFSKRLSWTPKGCCGGQHSSWGRGVAPRISDAQLPSQLGKPSPSGSALTTQSRDEMGLDGGRGVNRGLESSTPAIPHRRGDPGREGGYTGSRRELCRPEEGGRQECWCAGPPGGPQAPSGSGPWDLWWAGIPKLPKARRTEQVGTALGPAPGCACDKAWCPLHCLPGCRLRPCWPEGADNLRAAAAPV